MDYIPIESINDVDPAKISVRDLNNRYIDREGNRYATRFNMHTRRIEVVRIVKGKQEAIKVRHEIIQTKREERQTRQQTDEASRPEEPMNMEAMPTEADEASEAIGGASFDETLFVRDVMRDVEKMRERVLGVLNNVKRSTYFETRKDVTWNQVEREADAEILPRLEKAMNNHKELFQYPRSISYYASRLNDEHREKLEKMETDEHKLEWIRRWEAQEDLGGLYKKLEEFATRLKIVLDGVPDKDLSPLGAANIQAFRDSKSSANFIIQDSIEKLGLIDTWKMLYP